MERFQIGTTGVKQIDSGIRYPGGVRLDLPGHGNQP
jgi:hypothetical protein